jgi:hypothetical protein
MASDGLPSFGMPVHQVLSRIATMASATQWPSDSIQVHYD